MSSPRSAGCFWPAVALVLVCPPAPGADAPFQRGDANADGVVDIADAVSMLGYLFVGDVRLSCLDAADANDDALVDISDAVTTLG